VCLNLAHTNGRFKWCEGRRAGTSCATVAAIVAEDDMLLLEAAADADVGVLVPPAVLVDAVSTTVESPGVLVFTALAVLDVDGDELLDSARAVVMVGTGVDVALNPVVLDDVDASTLARTAVADDDVLLLNTCVYGIGVAVSVILEVVDEVNTSVVAALVAENDVLLLEAAANADVEVLVLLAVLVDAISATVEGSDGAGVAIPVILQKVDDVNTSVVAVLVAEDDVLLFEATAEADVKVRVPPAVLVNAVSATVEGSGVLVFTALVVLDVDGDELLDPARAEVLVGTCVDFAMNPVVLDDVDASTLALTAVADDDVLLLEAVDAEVEVLASPVVLEDVEFALGKTLKEPSSPIKLGAGLASLAPIRVSTD